MADPLFGPEIRLMLAENHDEGMRDFCDALHPATVAETLCDEVSIEDCWRVLSHTSISNQAAIFEYFPLDWQVRMVAGAGQPQMALLIEAMAPDDRVDLVRKLDPRVKEGLLRLVDEADRRDIKALVSHREGTAGAIMTTDYAWLPENLAAGEALDRLRLLAPDKETIYYVFVVNNQRQLLGVVSLRDLIMKPRSALLRDFMEQQPVKVNVHDDVEQVAQEIARYDLLAIPVIDDSGRLVGIVTHDDVIDVIQSAATEDLQRQAAVGPIGASYLEAGFFKIWRQRAIWLALLFVTGMLTANALEHFQHELETVSVLIVFVPLLISTGGNAGSQGAALLTRSLALGEITTRDWLRVLRHELLMGVALGLALGLLALFRTFVLTPSASLPASNPDPVRLLLTLAVAQSVALICIWGAVVGSMLPLLFKRLGVDPASASGPFVATFVDVTGILIYLYTARIYLGPYMAG